MRVNAQIVLAGLPPLNLTARHWGDWVWAVTDLGSGPVRICSVVDLDRERWLLPGTEAIIDVDPTALDQVRPFTVDWSSVPLIQDRVAANDPALADPRAARTRAAQVLAGAARPVRSAPPQRRRMSGASADVAPSSGPGLNMRPWAAACAEAIARTTSIPAPPGQMRVVAIVSAMRMMFTGLGHDRLGRPDPDDDDHGLYAKSMRGNETVFSVNVAGRAPWAVWVPDFQSPHRRPVYRSPELYPWLPALMPVDGRGRLEIVWDDVMEMTQQVQQLAAGSAAAQMAQANVAMQAWQARVAEVAAAPPPPAVAPAVASDSSGLPPQAHQSAAQLAAALRAVPANMRQMVIDQSRMGLNSLPPEMREAYLALWRSHGIPV